MWSISRKRLIASSLAACLAISLTACGGNKQSSPTKTLKEGEVAEFTWLHRLPDKKGAKTVKELVAEFNASHPNIKVNPETMQGSAAESYAKINSIVQTGKDVPCVTQIGNERVPDMMGSMMNVAEYTEKYKKDFIPFLYAKAQVGNQVFGFPQGASPILFFYRQDLFKEYGIEVPKTWDEYQKIAKVVKEKSGGKSYLGAFLQDEPMWINALSTSEGADWFDFNSEKQTWKVNIDSPETQKVAQYWQGIVDANLVKPLTRWGQDFNKFLSDGTIISTIGGAWEAPLIADAAPGTSGKWAVAQIPHFSADGKTVGQNGGTIAAILKGCKYPEQAVEFAHWWATNVDGLTGLGLLPAANADKISTPELLKTFYSGQDIYDEFVKANNNAAEVHWAPQVGETFRIIGDKQATVGTTGKVADVFKAGQESAIKSLEAVGVKVEGK